MRTFTRIISVLAVALSAMLIAPTAAHADTPGCVSKGEFRRVAKGMTKARVHNIFDTTGRSTMTSGGTGGRDEWRDYRVCRGWGNPRYSSVTINYDNYANPMAHRPGMRVYSKSSFIMR